MLIHKQMTIGGQIESHWQKESISHHINQICNSCSINAAKAGQSRDRSILAEFCYGWRYSLTHSGKTSAATPNFFCIFWLGIELRTTYQNLNEFSIRGQKLAEVTNTLNFRHNGVSRRLVTSLAYAKNDEIFIILSTFTFLGLMSSPSMKHTHRLSLSL